MSVLDVAPTLFAAFFFCVVVLVVLAAGTALRKERRRREQLQAHGARLGWLPIAAPMPEPVAKDARSRRCKLALGTRRGPYQLWMVWHQWVEHTGDNSSTTRNHTLYYLWLGPAYPDIELRRRTGIGAFFKPVRGVGTGDATFDKAFLVRPAGTHEQLRLLTPPLRDAMLARRLPAWSITAGVLITGYGDVPRVENFQPRADAICHLADSLT